ncbi:hypothetical protein ABZS29_14595 [Kribbella sp. NPDC005582]|uniref:hypothetical protein n=1 Tax=Kribbella sp. NPDC005582 TaxID=3156893 RepID=UPI0033AEDBAC
MLESIDASTKLCSHHLTEHEAVARQAVSVLMEWYDLSSAQARTQLREWAAQCDVSACQVAEAFVRGVYQGGPTTCPPATVRRLERLLREFTGQAEAR